MLRKIVYVSRFLGVLFLVVGLAKYVNGSVGFRIAPEIIAAAGFFVFSYGFLHDDENE